MRRYYSRKVIDVLIKVTKASLDMLRRKFISDEENDEAGGDKSSNQKARPVFILNSTLMIPNVSIRPSIDDLQEALITAGRNITGIAKGVAQWTSGKEVIHWMQIEYIFTFFNEIFQNSNSKHMVIPVPDVVKIWTTSELAAENSIACNPRRDRKYHIWPKVSTVSSWTTKKLWKCWICCRRAQNLWNPNCRPSLKAGSRTISYGKMIGRLGSSWNTDYWNLSHHWDVWLSWMRTYWSNQIWSISETQLRFQRKNSNLVWPLKLNVMLPR